MTDRVLECLEQSRERVEEHGSGRVYLDVYDNCCPLGAIMFWDGFSHLDVSHPGGAQIVLGKLSETARQALALLDAAAAEMYPHCSKPVIAAPDGMPAFAGPLERLNQYPMVPGPNLYTDRKARVLKVFDHVIAAYVSDTMAPERELVLA